MQTESILCSHQKRISSIRYCNPFIVYQIIYRPKFQNLFIYFHIQIQISRNSRSQFRSLVRLFTKWRKKSAFHTPKNPIPNKKKKPLKKGHYFLKRLKLKIANSGKDPTIKPLYRELAGLLVLILWASHPFHLLSKVNEIQLKFIRMHTAGQIFAILLDMVVSYSFSFHSPYHSWFNNLLNNV